MMSRTGLAAPAIRTRRRALFMDLQHGLGNRLRALASAATIAKNTDRQLLVIWTPDHHCQARLTDLIHVDLPLLSATDAAMVRADCSREYNYMEIEPGSRFREPVLVEDVAGDVYVRSAYSLVSPHTSSPAEDRFLKSLRVVSQVQALMARAGHMQVDAGVHIRMSTGPAFDEISYESPKNWPQGRHEELTSARKASDISRFVARLDTLIAAGEITSFFLAADLEQSYVTLQERYGARVRMLERPVFDRSSVQIQYALADMFLLARTPRFLASHWSSFSDLAQRLAPRGRSVEWSGRDF